MYVDFLIILLYRITGKIPFPPNNLQNIFNTSTSIKIIHECSYMYKKKKIKKKGCMDIFPNWCEEWQQRSDSCWVTLQMHPTCSGISFTDFKLGNKDMQDIQWEDIIMIRGNWARWSKGNQKASYKVIRLAKSMVAYHIKLASCKIISQ